MDNNNTEGRKAGMTQTNFDDFAPYVDDYVGMLAYTLRTGAPWQPIIKDFDSMIENSVWEISGQEKVFFKGIFESVLRHRAGIWRCLDCTKGGEGS